MYIYIDPATRADTAIRSMGRKMATPATGISRSSCIHEGSMSELNLPE